VSSFYFFSQGGFSGISVVIIADIVGLELYGSALGISTFLNGIGTLVSPPLVGRFLLVVTFRGLQYLHIRRFGLRELQEA